MRDEAILWSAAHCAGLPEPAGNHLRVADRSGYDGSVGMRKRDELSEGRCGSRSMTEIFTGRVQVVSAELADPFPQGVPVDFQVAPHGDHVAVTQFEMGYPKFG